MFIAVLDVNCDGLMSVSLCVLVSGICPVKALMGWPLLHLGFCSMDKKKAFKDLFKMCR